MIIPLDFVGCKLIYLQLSNGDRFKALVAILKFLTIHSFNHRPIDLELSIVKKAGHFILEI